MADVTCVGNLTADVVGKPIDALPERGRLSLVERMELHSGGNAANTGIGLAKLGVQTAVIGKVGSDGFGDFLVDCFAQQGIATDGIVRDAETATAATMVLVHGDGERSFIHYFGANATFRREDVDFARIQDSKILHFAGAFVLPAFDGEPMAELLRQARAADITTTLDTVWDAQGRWMSSLKPALPYVDYFLPSYDEARMLAGGRDDPTEIAQVLLDAGVYVVILKQGERGCYVRTRDDAFQIPAMNIPTVDELGAGDAFVSGFLTGLVKQWDLETCARFATAVGASCVQALGATTGIKSFGETLGLLPAVPQPIRGAA